LAADTPAHAVPPIPLEESAQFELGVFPPSIPRSTGPGEPWTVAAGTRRPDEEWIARKLEFVNGEQCQLLAMTQKSSNWDKPVGGEKSWKREDEVWVSTLDGTARKVIRVISQRDGIADVFAAQIKTKYELKSHEKLSGQTYVRTRRDVETAYIALSDATILARDAARQGPRVFESKLAWLDGYLEETAPGTPYREAIIAARRMVDASRRGEVLVPLPPLSSTLQDMNRGHWPEPGQSAPDVRAGNFQLSDQRGKPVVLVFFKPGNDTTDLSLAIADALEKRYGGDVPVIALAVFGDTAVGIKDRNRLKLTVPVQDGAAAASAYGVETIPRFAVIDSDGKVKWTFMGVGSETGFLLREQVDFLAHPTLPNGPSGKTPSPRSITIPVVPRP
jgi:peroxiredoxin